MGLESGHLGDTCKVLPRVLWQIAVLRKVLPRVLREIGGAPGSAPDIILRFKKDELKLLWPEMACSGHPRSPFARNQKEPKYKLPWTTVFFRGASRTHIAEARCTCLVLKDCFVVTLFRLREHPRRTTIGRTRVQQRISRRTNFTAAVMLGGPPLAFEDLQYSSREGSKD